MTCFARAALFCIPAFTLAFVACGGDVALFGPGSGTDTSTSSSGTSSGGTGTGTSSGGTGTSTGSTGTSTGSTGTSTGSTGTSTGSTGTSTGSTGTSTGTMTMTSTMTSTCDHALCELGGPLKPECDPCVQQVCNQDAYCCNANEGGWDYWCVNIASQICGLGCDNGLIDCQSQYGSSSSQILCEQGASTCQYRFNSYSQSCNELCQKGGGECFGAYNNYGQCGISWNEWLGCDDKQHQSAICLCSRGCGLKPPCGANQSCKDAKCQ